MDYTFFEKYPIQILGIDENYNSELTAIEEFVKSDIEYSGEIEDIESVLPYFVFYYFCEKRKSTVAANAGEQSQLAEFTVSSQIQQIDAWNIAIKKLDNICTEKQATSNPIYRSKRSRLW